MISFRQQLCCAAAREVAIHDVAVLALHDVIPFDLAIPCDMLGRLRLPDDRTAYRVSVCGEAGTVRARSFDLRAPYGLGRLAEADTVIVPGIADPERPIPGKVIAAVLAAWERGARITSICTGAFVLAAAGLLDGKRATTHWNAARSLAERYPAITVDPDVLFVDEGRIVTSAGMSAGIDMCLHLVRRDYGQAAAAWTARLAVASLNRDGGQAQFIRQEPPRSRASLAELIDWALANLEQPLDVDALARRAGMSQRTFARRFREQTGASPLQWLLAARIQRAQELLETSSAPIDVLAAAAGFDSPVTFRARFQRVVGVSPALYRRRFRDIDTAEVGLAAEKGYDLAVRHR